MAQFNSTIAVFGNLTKEMNNRVHLRIVVLGDGVQGYQRVEDNGVDLVLGDGVDDLRDAGVVNDQGAIAGGKLYLKVALRRYEEMAFQFAHRHVVVAADGGDAPVALKPIVVTVVQPDPKSLLRLLAKQIADGNHGDGFDLAITCLTRAAWPDRGCALAPLIVLAEQKLALWQGSFVERSKRDGADNLLRRSPLAVGPPSPCGAAFAPSPGAAAASSPVFGLRLLTHHVRRNAHHTTLMWASPAAFPRLRQDCGRGSGSKPMSSGCLLTKS